MDKSNQAGALNATQKPVPSQLSLSSQKSFEERALRNAQLQLWPDAVRGVPNTILRSGLFAAVGRGPRRFMERQEIAALKGITIHYTGQRLTQSDLDVWVGVLHLARLVPLGDSIEFTEKGFLREIGRGGDKGRSLGKSDRMWLRKVFARLSATTVEVKHGYISYSGSLIEEYWRDAESGRYVMKLNRRMILLFGHDSWTGLDWAVRQELRGQPLAQWLHGFYSTHADPLRYRYETLHDLCGSDAGAGAQSDVELNKAVSDWRDHSMRPAFEAVKAACEKFDLTFDWCLEPNGLVKVSRAPTNAQKKHLRRKRRPQPVQSKGDSMHGQGG